MKKALMLVIIVLSSALLCLAQTNNSPDQRDNVSAQTPLQHSGQDDFGRPVEPVATSALQAQPVPPPAAQAFEQNVKDVYFDFDRADLGPDDISALQQDAEWLKAHPEVTFTIEGDADQRGNIPYNLFLSDERALAARDQLVKLGVPEKQILFAEGWGKLYPVCQQEDEPCWGKQRRAHLAPWTPEAAPATSAEFQLNGAEFASTAPRSPR
ncbi:MAG TPA: OmpA family protein [Terriglobales bacterium]|nr:OmpA family protein [Terriglobales bacterium]